MPVVALVAYLLYLLLAVGWRTWMQVRRTGSSGFKGISGRAGSPEWLAGVLFVLAFVVGGAAPVLALTDVLEPIDALDGTAGHVAGIVLFAAGLLAILVAQMAMGSSWRIGVDDTERTELVTTGPFALVRNPIYAAMLPTSLGIVLMVPSVGALIGYVALVSALEIQVRIVEEPYLRGVHRSAYDRYTARVGRFVPGLGLQRATNR